MRKNTKIVCLGLSLLLCTCGATACGHTHAYGEWQTTPATCTQDGVKKRKCDCGDEQSEAIPATGHSFGEWSVTEKADCTKGGKKERVCPACKQKETQDIPKSDHIYTEYNYNATAHWGVCGVCGNEDEENATNHAFSSEWSSDENGHYHVCECGAENGRTAHSFKNEICTVCEYALVPTASLTYADVEGGVAVTGLKTGATDKNIVIPAVYEGKNVVAIAEKAFYSNAKIETVILGNNIKTIEKNAFYYAKNLRSVVIPEGVTSIGNTAFYYSGLHSVVIPSTVTSWGTNVFAYNWALEDVEIKCAAVGRNAFFGSAQYPSGVKRVKLSENTTTIAPFAFQGCTSLEVINLPEALSTIDQQAFDGAEKLNVEVTIKSGMTVQREAFARSGVRKATVNGGVVMSTGVFKECKRLGEAVITDSMKKVPDETFYGCAALTKISIGSALETIGNKAFGACNARQDVTIDPANNKFAMRDGAIVHKTYRNRIYLGPVSGEIFSDTAIIFDYAYSGIEAIKTLTFPQSVDQVSVGAFYGCPNLTSVTLIEKKTSLKEPIKTLAFENCKALTTVIVPANYRQIPARMFKDCTALSTVTFADPSGWCAMTTGGDLNNATPVDVSDPVKNAQLIKGDYKEGYFVIKG